MATYAFSTGVTSSPGWGDRWKMSFTGTWAFGDTWKMEGTYQSTAFTIGAGDVTGVGSPNYCYTFRNRVYLALGQQFNFSDNSAPTEFEEQGPGAGFILYLSQLGAQDIVASFSQTQGRLAVFARRSIQVWNVDADPNNFSIAQQLDNIGTVAGDSVRAIGDYDVLFLDDTGVRSLRTRETTLNAYVDDLGSPIDSFVRSAANQSSACAAVDPDTKNYWLYLDGTIYVFSKFPSSKISAWSTYAPVGNDNVAFTPQKFVVYNGQIFCRATNGFIYAYGGANGETYDASSNSQVTFQTAWLNDKRPDTFKQAKSVSLIMAGKWLVKVGMNPKVLPTDVVYNGGSAVTPNSLLDSTYDDGAVDYEENGTHFSVLAVSQNQSTTVPAVFSAITLKYNIAESK